MPLKIKTTAKGITAFAAREPFFIVTLVLTFILSFFSKPHIAAIHWNVIVTLLSLMLICHAFDRCQLLYSLAGLALGVFKTPRKLGLAMIFATGILAMFVTNDVALLAVVPLTLNIAKVSKKDPVMLIILETLSANLFSALTPFGNPQNLYLYSYFKIPPLEFFGIMLPFGLFSLVILLILDFAGNTGGAYEVKPPKFEVYDVRLLTGAAAAFLLNILSVFRLIDYRITLAATLVLILTLSPRLILKVDYCLLATFILFFLFTDSVSAIPQIRAFFQGVLNSGSAVLLASAGLSQVISNVPSAVLLSGFTADYKNLIYGVSAGGLGTLIASLASLISYKYYSRSYKSGRYLLIFTVLNFSVLVLLTAAVLLMEKLM